MMQNNIGEARRSYGLKYGKFTQDDAAAFFGVAGSTYKGWEQGVGNLNGLILCAIADKYECSTDYLLCRTEDPTPYPPVGELRTGSKDETRLVKAFRQCTKREQDVIVDTAEAMADRGLAKNTDDERAEESA